MHFEEKLARVIAITAFLALATSLAAPAPWATTTAAVLQGITLGSAVALIQILREIRRTRAQIAEAYHQRLLRDEDP